jgi:hypothetical protein
MPADLPRGHGVLVVRVWLEDHPEHPLRAVITEWSATTGVSTVVTASVEGVSSEVEAWIRRLLAGESLPGSAESDGPVTPR